MMFANYFELEEAVEYSMAVDDASADDMRVNFTPTTMERLRYFCVAGTLLARTN